MITVTIKKGGCYYTLNPEEIRFSINGREFTSKEIMEFVLKDKKSEESQLIRQKPVEGKWFEVDPKSLDESLFEDKRMDQNQEEVRRTIQVALNIWRDNPQKYPRSFFTLIPEKTWDNSKKVMDLRDLAEKTGDHMADWVEQALEWAQRINNGESWEELCNEPDTVKWSRLVIWSDGIKLVGGGVMVPNRNHLSSTNVGRNIYFIYARTDSAVPLVVKLK